MGTYKIPRDTKGEGRILMVFSTKALIYTAITGGFGFMFWQLLFIPLGLGKIGFGLMILFGLIGFAIATFKIPNSDAFEITKNAGGLNIDEVLLRIIKFKMNKNRQYIYKREGDKKDDN